MSKLISKLVQVGRKITDPNFEKREIHNAKLREQYAINPEFRKKAEKHRELIKERRRIVREEKLSKVNKGYRKGKTYEQIYGKEKAQK